MIVAWISMRESGGMPPRKILNLDSLRLLLTQSETNFPNNNLMAHMYVQ